MSCRTRSDAMLAISGGAILSLALASCGGGGGGGGGGPVGPEPPLPSECETGEAFDSTFQGIQKVIFEKHGCTQDVCHGSSAQGGLDLRAEAAYDSLYNKASLASSLPRVYPGDKDRSFLWLKLAKATDPSQITSGASVPGSGMPNGLPPLSKEELDLVRLWIYAGAPETGTVIDTEEILGGCLPDPKPITIDPLPAPAPGEGVQLVMPQWRLPAKSEHEICFASYFDISDQVPAEYRDPSGQFFRFRGQELRQDPQSHHLILNLTLIGTDELDDPSFGRWTCKGGERDGQACEPTDRSFCGSGLCGSDYRDGFACVGFGPASGGFNRFQIGGAQQAQSTNEFYDGVFGQIPMKGVLYWNSHAFNLTDEDHMMNGRINYYFADKQHARVNPIFNASRIFAANAAPFTTQTICNDHLLPQGSRLYSLNSHTHKHGKHFTVDHPDGTRIYESFVYNDPVEQRFEPPLAFDSPDPAERTLRYCSLYNNGVKEDGSPDVELVTRASRVPPSARQTLGSCRPIACVAGNVGAACNGENDDATCDSSPGAGDGDCDACRITGGESTENEMFILIGQFYMADDLDNGPASVASAMSSEPPRSPFVGIAVPPARACSTSHAGHASHAAAADDAAEQSGHDHAGHGG